MQTIEKRTPDASARKPAILLISGLLCGFADPDKSRRLGLSHRGSGLLAGSLVPECQQTCLGEPPPSRRGDCLTLGPSHFIPMTP